MILTKVAHFSHVGRSVVTQHCQQPSVVRKYGASVVSTSQGSTADIFMLLLVVNYKVQSRGDLKWHRYCLYQVGENSSVGSKLLRGVYLSTYIMKS
jgi:hypothetical protein